MRLIESLAMALVCLCALSFGGLYSLQAFRDECTKGIRSVLEKQEQRAKLIPPREAPPEPAPPVKKLRGKQGLSDEAAIEWLAGRFESRLGANVVHTTDKNVLRIKRNVRVSTKEELDEWKEGYTECNLECRLSNCAQFPVGRASPGEISRPSIERANFTAFRKREKHGPQSVDRPQKNGWKQEASFWRRRVDLAGVDAFQAAFGRSMRLDKEAVPCTEAPYVDYIVGLREHLPPRGSPRPPKREDDPDVQRLTQRFNYLQHDPEVCNSKARGSGSIGRVGIGGVLKILTLPFTWAFEQGAAFVLDDVRLEPSKASLWDLLEPFSGCSEEKVRRTKEWQYEMTPNFRSGKYTPLDYADKGHFWWVSQLLTYMFKPRPLVQNAIEKARRQLPPDTPFIGMHVRHGDKCEGDRPDGPGTADGFDFRTLDDRRRMFDHRVECGSFTDFMVHAEHIRSLYGIRTIWLATDDADVVDRAMTDPCYAHWDFHFQKMDRLVPADYGYYEDGSRDKQYGFEECQNVKDKDKFRCKAYRDRFNDTLTMLVDLAILAESDAMVLAFSSNIGRIAYELNAAKKNCLPPVISRDVGWCFTDGQILDGSPWGHLNC